MDRRRLIEVAGEALRLRLRRFLTGTLESLDPVRDTLRCRQLERLLTLLQELLEEERDLLRRRLAERERLECRLRFF